MKHRITFIPPGLTTSTPDGASVFDAANWAGLPIESICGGRGACGQCKVRLAEGAGAAGNADHRFLSEDQVKSGWRVACRTPIHSDCVVEVPCRISAVQTVPLDFGRAAPLDPNVRKVLVAEPANGSLPDLIDDLVHRGLAVRPAPERPVEFPPGAAPVTAVICGDDLIAVEPGDTTATNYGLALDIGTTTVVATIVNLQTGVVEATRSGLNAQAAFGADVIARISYTMQTEGGLQVLQSRIAGTINELIGQALAACGVDPQSIYEAVAVGNATMLHLLLGIDPAPIGVSPFTLPAQAPITVPAARLGIRLHPGARLTTLPHLGAYVGADIVAGLLATDLMRKQDGRLRLYIDVGTNSEIVLGCGERWLATAAPAGPAFEGGQIRCGTRATAGAIDHLRMDDDVRLTTVDGVLPPAGICGSGLIDAVAELRKHGILDPSGRFVMLREAAEKGCSASTGLVGQAFSLPAPFSAPSPAFGHLGERLFRANGGLAFQLGSPGDGIILTQADVRSLQLAKAAIASGTRVLLEQLDARPEDIHEILLAGAFGSYLNPDSARAAGLVPWIPLERIRPVGNAAAQGAVIALLSRRERDAARQLPEYVDYVELSGHPEFNAIFTDSLAFPQL